VKPQQNADVERINRTVRYEWRSQYHLEDLDHVQRFSTEWMWTYSHDRPNMALGRFTPKQRLTMATSLLLLNPVEIGGFPIDLSDFRKLSVRPARFFRSRLRNKIKPCASATAMFPCRSMAIETKLKPTEETIK
jgi:Integrase core domain